MITFVWWIVSLFGVCSLTWLPVFIDGCIALVLTFFQLDGNGDPPASAIVCVGIALFAACKYWFGLTISGWWILLSPVWAMLAIILPGGFTLTNYLLGHFGLMTVPTWVFITCIVVDVICVILELVLIFGDRKGRR